jgi:hypothetical protein
VEADARRVVNERDLLLAVRYGVPSLIVIGGLVLVLVSPDNLHGGLGIIGAGIAVGMLNLFFRIGVSGDKERDAEDAARDYFDLHGRWPDEDAGPAAGSS